MIIFLLDNFIVSLLLSTISDKYHQADLNRIRIEDRWLSDFLEHNNMNVKDALKHLMETCEWRQKFGTNGK